MKRKPRLTQKQKKSEFGTPAAYYRSKRHKAAVQLNNELNEAAESIQKKHKRPGL